MIRKKGCLSSKWLHLQNCMPNHLSILPDDINFRSHLVLKVIKICWRKYVPSKGGGEGTGDVSSWRLYPTCQPRLQHMGKKTNKLDHFGVPFFKFRPCDGHAALYRPPPPQQKSGSTISYTEVFRSPHKNNYKGVRSGELADHLTSSISISWRLSPIPPESVNSLMCGQP